MMRRGLANGLARTFRLRRQQRALEAERLLLIERREILKAGVGFVAVDGVPRLLHCRRRPLPRLSQVDQVIALGAIVFGVATRPNHLVPPKSLFRPRSAPSIKCSSASC